MSGTGKREGRVLGIDPGTRRIGLAVSDPIGITAQGLDTYDADGGEKFIIYLENIVDRYKIIEVVIGLPLSMSGGEIEGTGRSRELAARIRDRCGIEVALRDERMTSREAERVLGQAGGVRNKGDIDRLAAVLLLQGYLDERNG